MVLAKPNAICSIRVYHDWLNLDFRVQLALLDHYISQIYGSAVLLNQAPFKCT